MSGQQQYGPGGADNPFSVAGAKPRTVTATIANGAAQSGAVDCAGALLSFIEMPAGWTTAALSMLNASDGATYKAVKDATGNEWNIASGTMATVIGDVVFFDPPLAGRGSIKLRSGLKGAEVNQGAARTFVVGLVP